MFFVSYRNLLIFNKTVIDRSSSPAYHTPTKSTAKVLDDMVNSHPTRNPGPSSDPSFGRGYISNEPLINTPPRFFIPELPPSDVFTFRNQATPPRIPPVPSKPLAQPRQKQSRNILHAKKKSKHSSSKGFTRRLLEELNNLQHEYSSHESHHLHHEEDSLPRASSPTNSHTTCPHRSGAIRVEVQGDDMTSQSRGSTPYHPRLPEYSRCKLYRLAERRLRKALPVYLAIPHGDVN